MRAPLARSAAASLSEGDSRTSSVSGLKARPQKAIVRSCRVPTALLDEVREKMRLLLVGEVRRLGHAHRHAVRPTQVKEGLHVLREARSAVPGTGVEEALSDPRVAAHAQPDRVHVGARRVAEARELVHERHAHREHRVGGVLRQLARARVGHDDALARELQRGVEGAERLARVLASRAEDHAVGAEEVLNGRALLQKLGIRDDLERYAGLLVRIRPGLHGVARADRDGALDHDERGLLRGRRDSLGHGQHGAHVGRAVGTRRRSDGDEVGVGFVEAGGDLRRETKPPGALVAPNEIGQPRLVDRDDAVLELADPLGIDVDAEHVVPELREPRTRDETRRSRCQR